MKDATHSMKDIGKAIRQCAAAEWQKGIQDIPNGTEWIEGVDRENYDPENPDGEHQGDPERIVHYHESSGASWPTDDGYQEDRDFWCGVFGGFCASEVGNFLFNDRCVDLTLGDGIGKWMFPSTVRLRDFGPKSWAEVGPGYRMPLIVDPANARPGDFPIVKTGRTNREYGDHVTICRQPADGGIIRTFEGNANGRLPGDLGTGEGVVKGRWKYAQVGCVLRLRREHFQGGFLEKIER